MKILVTGSNGLLGQHLIQSLTANGHDVVGIGKGNNRLNSITGFKYVTLDITDGTALHDLVVAESPAMIIHAAAMTQVDKCEEDKQSCYNINVSATRFLVDSAREVGAGIIYISTDFVFDGLEGPYKEDDVPNPVNYYGSTKLAAERAIMESKLEWAVVRTVLVFGDVLEGTRSNIISWVKQNLQDGKSIKVVADQIRTPTYVKDLVQGILLIIEKKKTGIFHISGSETLSPYDMAIKTAEHFRLPIELIEKTDSASFTQPGQRPLRTGFIIRKAEEELGYKPTLFAESIASM